MLMLAAIALVLPAAYRSLLDDAAIAGLGTLSVAISLILLLVYALFLVFSLVTHSSWFAGTLPAEDREAARAPSGPRLSEDSPRPCVHPLAGDA